MARGHSLHLKMEEHVFNKPIKWNKLIVKGRKCRFTKYGHISKRGKEVKRFHSLPHCAVLPRDPDRKET